MKLKVCGMKYQSNIEEIATLHPDYIGLIFYKGSPRFVGKSKLEVPGKIKKVGVFVDADLKYIIEQIAVYGLQAVQLHGDESPDFCRELRAHYDRENTASKLDIIKVFLVDEFFSFSTLKAFEEACNYYLFDAKGELPGGNSISFNWNLLKNYPSEKPFFLSGGIGLGNLEDLKRFRQSKVSKYCHAIDVNSKFEIEPGRKNLKELKEFKFSL